MSYAEISYITEFEPIRLQKSINDLQRTNMITTVSDAKITDNETQYTLSEFARSYLRSRHQVKDTLVKVFLSRNRKLVAELEEQRNTRVNLYSPRTIRASNKSEIVVSGLLKKALELESLGNFDEALKLTEQARSLLPYFAEIYRIDGWIRSRQGDTIGANEAYERAIEYNPQYAPLRYFYGNFLMHSAEDTEGAIAMFKAAESILPEDAEIKLQIARCFLYMKDFPQAKRYLDAAEAINSKNHFVTGKLHDLRIQLLARRADFEARSYKKVEALTTIEEMRDYYQSLPSSMIDAKIHQSIRKVKQNLEWLYRQEDPMVSSWSSELLNWLKTV